MTFNALDAHLIFTPHSRLISTKEFPIADIPYVGVVLVEPTLVSRDVFYSRYEERKAAIDFAVNTTSTRRDTWRSKSEAFTHFMKRIPWKEWDPRIVRLLVVRFCPLYVVTVAHWVHLLTVNHYTGLWTGGNGRWSQAKM